MLKYVLLVYLLISIGVIGRAQSAEIDERVRNYDIVYRMFDCPAGINEISSLLYLQNNLNSLAEIMLADKDGFPYVVDDKPDGQVLVIDTPNNFEIAPGLPHPNSIVMCSNDEMLSVTYLFPLINGNPENIKTPLHRLLEVNDRTFGKEGEYYYGAYEHKYFIDAQNNSLSMTCKMPVIPENWYSVPAGCIDGLGYDVIPKTAPCNDGIEPFNKFLKNFNSDVQFRSSRVASSVTTEAQEHKAGLKFSLIPYNQCVMESLEEAELLPLKGDKKSKQVDGYEDVYKYGRWYYPSLNRVIYSGWNNEGLDEFDSRGIVILFERANENAEWNCTETCVFGAALQDIIRKNL